MIGRLCRVAATRVAKSRRQLNGAPTTLVDSPTLRLRRQSSQRPCTVGALPRGSCFRLVAVADRQTCPRRCCRHGARPDDDLQEQHIAVGRMRTSLCTWLSCEGPMDPLLPTGFPGRPCRPRTETRRQRTQRTLQMGAVVVWEASAMLSRRWCWLVMSPWRVYRD